MANHDKVYWTQYNEVTYVYRRNGKHVYYLDSFGLNQFEIMRRHYPNARFDWVDWIKSNLGLVQEDDYNVY